MLTISALLAFLLSELAKPLLIKTKQTKNPMNILGIANLHVKYKNHHQLVDNDS
jgi:hypothetical protein